MKLNKTDVVILKLLAKRPEKTSTLAEKTKLSKSRTSAILSGLAEEGFLEKKGWTYQLSKNPQATAVYTLLKKYPTLSAENLLPKTELNVLKALTQQQTVKDIANTIGKTERTVYKKIQLFKSMGLVIDLGGGAYTLHKTNPIYEDLKPLLENKICIHPTTFDDPDTWVAWSGEDELIIKTRNPKKTKEKIAEKGWRWKYTSESALDHYGIHLIPPETTLYLHKGDEEGDYVRLEDAIAHMLLENNEKAVEYGKWLILLRQGKIDLKRLKQKAKKYNINKKIEGLLYDLKPVLQ